MKRLQKNTLTLLVSVLLTLGCHANGKFVPFKYGNFDTWVVRHVHESSVIGGNTKTLYEIGPNHEITGEKPYVNLGGSPWGTSNVMAKVMGVVKTIPFTATYTVPVIAPRWRPT